MQDDLDSLYGQVAGAIVARLKKAVSDTIEYGSVPDLTWRLERAIFDALVQADEFGCQRTRAQFKNFINEFDQDDGTSSN